MKKQVAPEDFLPDRLAMLSNLVGSRFASAYGRRFGLGLPEWRVIAVLRRSPGLSAGEVAGRALMDKVAVSRAVAKLLKSGRVNRRVADADRRRSILTLTEAGRQLHDQLAPLALEFQDELLHGLDEADIRALHLLTERLLARARQLARL